jgi:putative mRNA 3-end processing factor
VKLRFLGGAREVGRSAVLVDDRLLLDYGMLAGDPPRYPLDAPAPEAVVVSHGHLDHAGLLPALLAGEARPPVHWTPPTRDLARLLARDTLKLRGGTYDCPFTEAELRRLGEVSHTHGYDEPFEPVPGYEVRFHDAGHVPGSAHVVVDNSEARRASGNRTGSGDGETRLLYTGDFYTDDRRGADGTTDRANGRDAPASGQRLLSGTTARPDADVVVCESTYSDVSHDPRSEVEARFAEALRETVWNGGTAVVPAFAVGRTQEVLLICAAHDIDCYVDGMGRRVTRQFLDQPDFLRDADALREAAGRARFVTNPGQRERIARKNTVIVTTSGMLSGGPAMTYVPAIRGSPTNLVAMTGYQVEGTPGRELLDRGRAEFDGRVLPVSARVEAFDFSAHADREGLLAFLDSYRDARVLVNHGDRCEAFAAELRADGYDAGAPDVGETVEV